MRISVQSSRVQFSRDGKSLAIAESDALTIIDVRGDGRQTLPLPNLQSIAAFGDQVWAATHTGQLIRVRIDGQIVDDTFQLSPDRDAQLVPAAVGPAAALWSAHEPIVILDDLGELVTHQVGADAMIPVSGRRVIRCGGPRVTLPSGAICSLANGAQIIGGAVLFDGNAFALVTEHAGGAREGLVLALASGRIQQGLALPSGTTRIAARRGLVIVQETPRRLAVFDLRFGRRLGVVNTDSDVIDLAVDPDGAIAALLTDGGHVELIALRDRVRNADTRMSDDRPSERGTSETPTSEPGTTQTNTSETRASETSTSETGTSETGTSETRTSETRTSETGTSETGTSETRTSETGTSETGTSETGTSETSTSETGTSETTTSETRASEIGLSETRASEIGLSETRASETRVSETRASGSRPLAPPKAARTDTVVDLRALEPRSRESSATRADALVELDLDVRTVMLWTLGAIAQAWDTHRLGYGNEGRHPYEHEVAAIVGVNAGFAKEYVEAAAEQLAAHERMLAIKGHRGGRSPLAMLVDEFHLSPSAIDVLLVIAAPALHGDIARLYGVLANDSGRSIVDELLVQQVLDGRVTRHDIAAELQPSAPLVQFGIVEVGIRRARPFAPLSVDPVVLTRLRGETPDLGAAPIVRQADRALDELELAPGVLAAACAALARASRPARIAIRGRAGSGRRALLAALAREAGRALGVIDAALLPRDADRFGATLRLALRRAQLAGLFPTVICLDTIVFDDRNGNDLASEVLRAHPGPLAVISPLTVTPPLPAGHMTIDLPVLSETERLGVWQQRSVIVGELEYYKSKADPKGAESNEEYLRMVKVVVKWDGKMADMGAASD